MVEIKNLTKRFGNITAVKSLSFSVEKNEILGFLGPNGAGKSTTMNMITGYLPSTSGTVVINGFDISQNPKEAKKCIGYLPELPPLYMDMRVIEYLKFAAGIKGVPRSERKAQIDNCMERLKITDVSHRVIKNLSKGYRQRVGFAQALLGNPEVLILDEPTVGLDPNQILEVRDLIKELKKDHTIILSSHILQEISAVCERVVIISGGEIQANDTIENLAKIGGANLIITLTVEGDKDKIRSIIESSENVVKITDFTEVSDSSYQFKFEISDNNAKKTVLSKLISEDCSVSDIKSDSVNLEDIFVKLTKQNGNKKSLKDVFAEMEAEMDTDSNSDKAETNK